MFHKGSLGGGELQTQVTHRTAFTEAGTTYNCSFRKPHLGNIRIKLILSRCIC